VAKIKDVVSCPGQVNSVVTSTSTCVCYKQLTKVTFTTAECGNQNKHALSPHNGTDKAVPVHRMKAYRGCRGTAPLVLIPALDGGEWPTSHPTPTEHEAGWAPETVWTF